MATKVEFKESAVHAIEVNGIVYDVAERTGELEQKIIAEYDEKQETMTEYERYKTLICLLLGEDDFTEIFPGGEKESLNKMAQVAWYAQREFNAEANAIEKQKLAEKIENSGVEEVTEKLDKFNRQVDKTVSKANTAKKKK